MSERSEMPDAELPSYLHGLQLPVSTSEVLAYAEERGAPEEALEFIESLPAAVFTTEEGMRNAFSEVRDGHYPESHPEDVAVGVDGTSS